jgi:hypothetical protein
LLLSGRRIPTPSHIYGEGKERKMGVTLSLPWELSTDHPTAHSGEPVLVNQRTGEAIPSTHFVEAFSAWGRMTAVQTVWRMGRGKKFQDD